MQQDGARFSVGPDSSVMTDDCLNILPSYQHSFIDASVAEFPNGETEVDADSLSSGESDADSTTEIEEIELFRFSRQGLSVRIDLDNHTKSLGTECRSLKQRDGYMSVVQIINFEEQCRLKCPSILIGCNVPRYSPAPGDTYKTVPNNNPMPKDVGTGKGLMVPTTIRKDRFSAVVADIERRLNRQGIIGDPRSVCRKGGGRSGEYYETDDTFFDDAEAYEQLGVDYSNSRGSPDLEDDIDEDESEYEFDYYVEEAGHYFTFDDDHEADAIDLGSLVIHPESTTEPQYSEQPWIDPRAWRVEESKLPDYVRKSFIKLESAIEPFGDSNGICVKERIIYSHLRNMIEEVFRLTYPSISWDIVHHYKEILTADATSDVKHLTPPEEGTPDSKKSCDDNNEEQVVEESKTKRTRKPPKKRRYNVDQLVQLEWEHYNIFLQCLRKVTSLMKRKALDSIWVNRLVLHNALVYNELENDIVEYIFKHSILFRKKKSHFLRNVKKSQQLFQAAYETLSYHVAKSTDSSTTLAPQLLPDDAMKSPFFPVAAELLNWCILYNCRRDEQKSIHFNVEHWPSNFSKYLCEKLNGAIAVRRRDLNDKERVVLKRLFLEETLKKFKHHFKVSTLYERRSKTQTVPQFIIPCKAIGLRGAIVRKKTTPIVMSGQEKRSDQQSSPQLEKKSDELIKKRRLVKSVQKSVDANINDESENGKKRRRIDEGKAGASKKRKQEGLKELDRIRESSPLQSSIKHCEGMRSEQVTETTPEQIMQSSSMTVGVPSHHMVSSTPFTNTIDEILALRETVTGQPLVNKYINNQTDYFHNNHPLLKNPDLSVDRQPLLNYWNSRLSPPST